MYYFYLIGCIILLVIWFFIFLILKKEYKKEMIVSSLIISIGGFLQIFFVPVYWNPEVLFSFLGFDIESFIFSFSTGGIASSLYQLFFKGKYKFYIEKNYKKYFINRIIIFVPIALIFISIFIPINFMYSIFIIMTIQIVLVSIVRKDLIKDMIFGTISFMIFYNLFCLFFFNIFSGFLNEWSIFNLSGIILLNVPIEETIWAGYFGTFASIIYKYIFWLKRIN
ncbi:MAG: lycopene cyclase domain-containing protein [Candidatus Woesearchaeota archaeon]